MTIQETEVQTAPETSQTPFPMPNPWVGMGLLAVGAVGPFLIAWMWNGNEETGWIKTAMILLMALFVVFMRLFASIVRLLPEIRDDADTLTAVLKKLPWDTYVPALGAAIGILAMQDLNVRTGMLVSFSLATSFAPALRHLWNHTR